MIHAQANLQGWARRTESLRRNVPAMSRASAVELANQVARFMQVQPHQDTHRWSRGFIDAARSVGATDVPLPVVVPSKYWVNLKNALLRYRNLMRTRYQEAEAALTLLYPTPPQNTRRGLYARLLAKKEKARERLQKAQENLWALGDNPTAIVIHAGLGGFAGGGSGSRRPPQVVTRIYGGSGQIASGPSGAVVRLVNREAHARIVESKFGVMRAVRAAAQGFVLTGQARQRVIKTLKLPQVR